MSTKAYIQNLVKNGQVVSEKSKSLFSYVNDLGPRARNDLDLEYPCTFIYSTSCLHLPTFRSQATIISEKSTGFTFSYTNSVTKFDLVVNSSGSILCHHLNNL